MIKNTVPIREPRVDAEKSPYPMVVIDIMLYQKLSPMVRSGCTGPSKKKNVRAFPTILVINTANMVRKPRVLLRRIRCIIFMIE